MKITIKSTYNHTLLRKVVTPVFSPCTEKSIDELWKTSTPRGSFQLQLNRGQRRLRLAAPADPKWKAHPSYSRQLR